jgi:hypothetical protein
VFVAGSYIFKSANQPETIKSLRTLVNSWFEIGFRSRWIHGAKQVCS